MNVEKTAGPEKATNTEKTFDDLLVRHLQTQHNYIDDDGFSARVMANIPAARKINPIVEKLIFCLPVLIITALVISQFPWRDVVQYAYAILLTVDTASLLKAGVLLLSTITATTVLWGVKRLDII